VNVWEVWYATMKTSFGWRLAMDLHLKPVGTNDPESKGKVESSIKYVKRDFLYACTYT